MCSMLLFDFEMFSMFLDDFNMFSMFLFDLGIFSQLFNDFIMFSMFLFDFGMFSLLLDDFSELSARQSFCKVSASSPPAPKILEKKLILFSQVFSNCLQSFCELSAGTQNIEKTCQNQTKTLKTC